MTKLIKDGAIVGDDWQGTLLSLEDYNAALASGNAPAENLGVRLEPGDSPASIAGDINAIPVVAVNFPSFMDGRGFSYARELRERGYQGEIRAVGDFMRDQLGYLSRCGVNAFEFPNEVDIEPMLSSLREFSDNYQADILQPQPLFRRR